MLRKNIYRILLCFWFIVILVLSLINIKTGVKVKVLHVDKFVHFCFYFVFSWILIRVFLQETKRVNFFMIAGVTFIISSFIGILMELLQSYYTINRRGDIKDVIFNIFGTVVAILLTYLVRDIKKK